jgi:hypothetical protein
MTRSKKTEIVETQTAEEIVQANESLERELKANKSKLCLIAQKLTGTEKFSDNVLRAIFMGVKKHSSDVVVADFIKKFSHVNAVYYLACQQENYGNHILLLAKEWLAHKEWHPAVTGAELSNQVSSRCFTKDFFESFLDSHNIYSENPCDSNHSYGELIRVIVDIDPGMVSSKNAVHLTDLGMDKLLESYAKLYDDQTVCKAVFKRFHNVPKFRKSFPDTEFSKVMNPVVAERVVRMLFAYDDLPSFMSAVNLIVRYNLTEKYNGAIKQAVESLSVQELAYVAKSLSLVKDIVKPILVKKLSMDPEAMAERMLQEGGNGGCLAWSPATWSPAMGMWMSRYE